MLFTNWNQVFSPEEFRLLIAPLYLTPQVCEVQGKLVFQSQAVGNQRASRILKGQFQDPPLINIKNNA